MRARSLALLCLMAASAAAARTPAAAMEPSGEMPRYADLYERVGVSEQWMLRLISQRIPGPAWDRTSAPAMSEILRAASPTERQVLAWMTADAATAPQLSMRKSQSDWPM
jgi:hypothetical protein